MVKKSAHSHLLMKVETGEKPEQESNQNSTPVAMDTCHREDGKSLK